MTPPPAPTPAADPAADPSTDPGTGAPASLALPVLAVLFGLLTFSGMDAAMKALVLAIGVANAVLWRYVVGIALIAPIYLARRRPRPGRAAMTIHLQRAGVIVVMAFLFFWGLARVPLAEGVAISFIAPIIALYLARVFLGETIHRNAGLASLLGLAGIAVMLWGRLAGDYDAEAAKGFAAVLASAALYGANLVMQRHQALLAEPVEISFFQNLFVGAAYLVAAPFYAAVPPMGTWWLIAFAAALAVTSALFVSWGYRRAEAQVLVNLEYSAFIWAALFGWLFFAEPLGVSTLIGAALIVAGCLAATRRPRKPVRVGAV